MKLLPILLASSLTVALAVTVFAADPDGFAMFKAADIKSRLAAAKLDDHKAGLDRAGTWGNHGLLLVRREGDGEAAPNEIRGKSLTGGVRYPMAPGDVFHIPAKVPHQMLVPKSLLIEVVKVTTN